MKVLIINPILYTPPVAGLEVHKLPSIKHTLFYNLALGFLANGDEPTMICSEEYKPTQDLDFDFKIIFLENKIKKRIKRFPNGFPILSGLRGYLEDHHEEYDRIIVSETFTQGAFWASRICPEKTLIWQEVARFIPGKKVFCWIWYNFVVKCFLKKSTFVGRSPRAVAFLKKYVRNVSDKYVHHGINVDVFQPRGDKQPYFIVQAQLIPRKRIDVTIRKFAEFYNQESKEYQLYIVGGGPLCDELKSVAGECGVPDSVKFLGQLNQAEVGKCLSSAKIMLTDTSSEFNMVSIAESVASGTPVISNGIPYNSDFLEQFGLGIKDDNWNFKTIRGMLDNYDYFYSNCVKYRERLSYKSITHELLSI